MVKAKDIIKIKKEHEKYKKLLENECDFVKRLKYKSLIRECEDKLMDIEIQLLNISMGLYKNWDIHQKVFHDRYIYNVPVKRLVDKYGVSRSTIYRILGSATEAFESSKWKF